MIAGHVQWLVARLVLVALLATVGPIHARGQNGDQLTDLRAQVSRLYEQGKYADALTVAERYVDLAHQKQGQDHTEYPTAISWLAYVYKAQGRYPEAESLFKLALAIREKALGPDHSAVGASLNNLASLYRVQGRYPEAEPLHKRDLAITEKALGPDHPDVATSLNNLAALYLAQGRYAEAEPLHKRALSIREKALGADHPDVGNSFSNLAALYGDQGRYAEAEPFHKRALVIRENLPGVGDGKACRRVALDQCRLCQCRLVWHAQCPDRAPRRSSLKALRGDAKPSRAADAYIGFGNPLLTGPEGSDKRAWDLQRCQAPEGGKRTRVAQAGRAPKLAPQLESGLGNVADLRRQYPLPETTEELCAVARARGIVDPDKAVNLGAKATEARVKALSANGTLARARVVHFATHGLVAGETAMFAANHVEPALLLTPPEMASEEDDGLLTASEVGTLKLDADWVILSACNTAAGDSVGRRCALRACPRLLLCRCTRLARLALVCGQRGNCRAHY